MHPSEWGAKLESANFLFFFDVKADGIENYTT